MNHFRRSTVQTKPLGQNRLNTRATERTVLVEHPNVPEGSVRNGHKTYTVQHLVISPEVLHYKWERWITPDGESLTAPLSQGVEAHYSAGVRRLAVTLYSLGQSTFTRVTELFNEAFITISKRTVVRMVNSPSCLRKSMRYLRPGSAAALRRM